MKDVCVGSKKYGKQANKTLAGCTLQSGCRDTNTTKRAKVAAEGFATLSLTREIMRSSLGRMATMVTS